MTMVLPRASIRPASSAARPTAPPGTTTSLNSRNTKATAAPTSSSVAVTPWASSRRLIAKVISPGTVAINASQMVRPSALVRFARAGAQRAGVVVKAFGLGRHQDRLRVAGLHGCRDTRDQTAADAAATTMSGVMPSAAKSSAISRPTVPCRQ